MTFTLGSSPDSLVVKLVSNEDFLGGLRRKNGPWSDGVSLKLVFDSGTTWDAIIDGDLAYWRIDKADVNTQIATRKSGVRLRYVNGPTDVAIGVGEAAIYRG